MFNPKEYWEKKQERKRLSESNFAVATVKALAKLSGIFCRDTFYASDKPVFVGHSRSPKERRMRRIRHRSMMRNQG